jgi:hypothetical protein
MRRIDEAHNRGAFGDGGRRGDDGGYGDASVRYER